jgi:hypothetical protein
MLGRFSGRSGAVTVIEEPVRRNIVRNAKIAFFITWAVIGLLAANIAASMIHPPALALITGIFAGFITAVIVFLIIAAWPVLRALWWWLPELATAGLLTGGWIELADHAGLTVRIIVSAAVIGIPAGLKPVRRRINAATWCVITRHRLRVCFSEFIISNRTGSLPLILWARPTSVGERVWVILRPGLALEDVQSQLDKIAVACWGATASAEAASTSNSAYVRMDIKRRDALTGTISSPLLGLLPFRRSTPHPHPVNVLVPDALDLPDITTADVTPAKPAAAARTDKRTPWPDRRPDGQRQDTQIRPGDTDALEDWI